MKKSFFLLSFLLIGIISISLYNCTEDDNNETCLQDEYCEAQTVTVCCTSDNDEDCVYKFDGKEYAYNELEQLNEDLGCGAGGMGFKSTGKETNLSDIKTQLKALMSKVQTQIRSNK